MTCRLLVRSVLASVVAAASLAMLLYFVSEQRLRTVYPVPSIHLDVQPDPAAVARGDHLVHAIGTCAVCHGEDYGGAIYADVPFVGMVAGPNLTRGRGGIAASLSDEDWVRAVRYGTHRDGTSLVAMPSEVFTHFNDADLGAIIAYLRQLPPVDRDVPRTHFRIGGRLMLALGRLNILTAPKTSHGTPATPFMGATKAYGAYLARAAGCAGCHGYGFSGGRVAGPPGLPPAANITPTGIGAWTERDFRRVMREGRRPDGRVLDSFMPWRYYGQMSDVELQALWLYLRSLPPKATGGK